MRFHIQPKIGKYNCLPNGRSPSNIINTTLKPNTWQSLKFDSNSINLDFERMNIIINLNIAIGSIHYTIVTMRNCVAFVCLAILSVRKVAACY